VANQYLTKWSLKLTKRRVLSIQIRWDPPHGKQISAFSQSESKARANWIRCAKYTASE
jgi:hypothetical protein